MEAVIFRIEHQLHKGRKLSKFPFVNHCTFMFLLNAGLFPFRLYPQ